MERNGEVLHESAPAEERGEAACAARHESLAVPLAALTDHADKVLPETALAVTRRSWSTRVAAAGPLNLRVLPEGSRP